MSGDFSRFGPELRRVRRGERADEQGGKKVWHQARDGVEVISHVDSEGRVTRQECYLDGAVAIWCAGQAVATGTLLSESAGLRVKGSEAVIPDTGAIYATVERALTLLRAAPPGDQYLDHFRAELDRALEGMEPSDEATVTSSASMAEVLAAVGAEAPRRSRAPLIWLGVAAAAALVAVVLVLLR